MRIVIRTNGRGNAWPLELGATGNRHQSLISSASEYANTSLSILGYHRDDLSKPSWEVLFDIGQGVLPFLVQHGNRLPDAVLLSHPHYDHVSGLDWLGASARRNRNRAGKLPVFTTSLCWQEIIKRFPWLSADFDMRPLDTRVKTPIAGIEGLSVTAFPVFHGAYAPGACLMLLEHLGGGPSAKAILSGDLLCPLIGPKDYDLLHGARIAYLDANTRFPCPQSGHWSIVETRTHQHLLTSWIADQTLDKLFEPHAGTVSLPSSTKLGDLCWSIETFVQRISPHSTALVHYSGYEDVEILTDTQLCQWVGGRLDATSWHIPTPGQEFVLYDGP